MPYREHPDDALCHQCDSPAPTACPCCSRPTCPRHLAPRAEMCGRCDEAYSKHMRPGFSVLAPWLLGLMLAVVVASRVPAVALGYVVLGYPAIAWWRKHGRRRTFFQRMKTHGALAAASPPSAEDQALVAYEAKLADRRADQFVASFSTDDGSNREG